MDIAVGSIVTLKKQHPCGSKEFKVQRVGADFKLECLGCGSVLLLPRSKVEKNVRGIRDDG